MSKPSFSNQQAFLVKVKSCLLQCIPLGISISSVTSFHFTIHSWRWVFLRVVYMIKLTRRLPIQVVFIGTSYATLYLMYMKFKATYDQNHDTFRIEFLLIPVTILALIINHEFAVFEVSLTLICVKNNPWSSPISRCYGLFPFTWKQLPSFLSCSWFRKLERLRVSHPITCLPSDPIELSIFSIGSTDTTWKGSMIGSLSSQVLFKQSSTATSSISTWPEVSYIHYW